MKFQSELSSRIKAESVAVSAEEEVGILKRKLSSITESTERERKRLNNELEQLNSESQLSVSRISADVSLICFSESLVT